MLQALCHRVTWRRPKISSPLPVVISRWKPLSSFPCRCQSKAFARRISPSPQCRTNFRKVVSHEHRLTFTRPPETLDQNHDIKFTPHQSADGCAGPAGVPAIRRERPSTLSFVLVIIPRHEPPTASRIGAGVFSGGSCCRCCATAGATEGVVSGAVPA